MAGGVERLPNDIMMDSSTHVEPDWEVSSAVFRVFLDTVVGGFTFRPPVCLSFPASPHPGEKHHKEH